MPGKYTALAWEKVTTKGCTWRGDAEQCLAWGNFTKAKKCGLKLAHTSPATVSDVQYCFLTSLFLVVNNLLV